MLRKSASAFVALFLLVLQLFGPFLHAHAHEPDAQPGLHVHLQNWVAGDADLGFKADSGADHRVEAMPEGCKPDAALIVPNVGDSQLFPPLCHAAMTLVEAAGLVQPLPGDPPGGAFPDHTFPPSLAPPLV